MTDQLEQRVKDLEDLIADIPHLMNLRLESLNAAVSETGARLNLLDKQMTIMTREMRDLRGGVTRMLVEQNKRIAGLEAHMGAIDGRIGVIEGRIGNIEDRVDGIEGRMGAIEGRIESIEGHVKGIDTKLDLVLSRLLH